MQIDPRMVKWDETPTTQEAQKIDPKMVKWDESEKKTEAGVLTNLLAGGVRGAGSIGATILAPWDIATAAMEGKGLTLENNRQRREAMDAGLQELVGADPTSLAYRGGKLAGEIAGTAGAGGALGNVALRVGMSAPIVQGLASGGLNVAGRTGLAGLATRAATGAVTGGVAAGAVNPEYAAQGALIGGALPLVAKTLGAAGDVVGRTLNKSAPVSPQKLDAAKRGLEAGYVLPPSAVKPTLKNQVLESISGKQATEQIASVRNAEQNQRLVRQALGVADDAPLNQGTLKAVRDEAGKVYKEVASLPKLPPQSGSSIANIPPKPGIDPKAMVEQLKQARNDAQTWFKSYNASANPEHLAKARAADALSKQLESGLESYAQTLGRGDLIPALREARTQIAKTYTVERALNQATGNIEPQVFARLYQKGKPLSGGLEKIGEFASAFPTVAKNADKIGSPAVHNLKAGLASVLSGGGALAAGPVGLAAGAIPFIAPPVARSIMFSPAAQRGLLEASSDPVVLDGLLSLTQKTLPVLGAR